MFRWKSAVVQLSSQYELLVKILLTPPEPVQQFVQSYILLLTDSSMDTFVRVLSVKGVYKAADQQLYFQELHKLVPPTPSGEAFLSSETVPKTNNWSQNLMTKLKDLGFTQLKSYSRSKEVRQLTSTATQLQQPSSNASANGQGI